MQWNFNISVFSEPIILVQVLIQSFSKLLLSVINLNKLRQRDQNVVAT